MVPEHLEPILTPYPHWCPQGGAITIYGRVPRKASFWFKMAPKTVANDLKWNFSENWAKNTQNIKRWAQKMEI